MQGRKRLDEQQPGTRSLRRLCVSSPRRRLFLWLRRLMPSPSYLSATCSPTANWTVDPLSGDPRATYNPPAGQLINQCQCTTVLYSLLQACSTCQACSILPWGAWSSACPSTYIGKTYPYAIPSGTQIPGWAYLDVTASGDGSGWNETAAEQYAREYRGMSSHPLQSSILFFHSLWLHIPRSINTDYSFRNKYQAHRWCGCRRHWGDCPSRASLALVVRSSWSSPTTRTVPLLRGRRWPKNNLCTWICRSNNNRERKTYRKTDDFGTGP